MIIIGIVLAGMLVGGAAQLIVGRSRRGVDWGSALLCGLAGSLVGGLVISLLAGDGFDLRPSGAIGSLGGALLVTSIWTWWRRRSGVTARPS